MKRHRRMHLLVCYKGNRKDEAKTRETDRWRRGRMKWKDRRNELWEVSLL